MENISIPVPASVAQAFNKADASVKRRAEVFINVWLNNFLNNKSANEQLFATMRKATQEAKTNDLTPEGLDELLNDGV